MRTLLPLLRLAAPLICIGMILSTLVEITYLALVQRPVQNGVTAVPDGVLVLTPLVLAPYLAVGIITYLARKNWVAVFFGFIAALVTAWFGILLMCAFPGCDISGQCLATGMVSLFEWPLIGGIAATAFIVILIQKGTGLLSKKYRQRSE